MPTALWDYMSTSGVPANSTALLDVDPQRVMAEIGVKNQIVHLGDDNSEEVITLGSTTAYYVNLQWDVLTSTDAGAIFDFWNSSSKANGIARTFRWAHPTDTHTYTVRFDTDISRSFQPGDIASIGSVRLRVMGRAT